MSGDTVGSFVAVLGVAAMLTAVIAAGAELGFWLYDYVHPAVAYAYGIGASGLIIAIGFWMDSVERGESA